MRDLGVLPGGDNSYAQGINDAGDIVGWRATQSDNGGLHAVRWHAGRMIDMDPGGVYSIAHDLTNNGLVVRSRITFDDPQRNFAVAWRHNVPTALTPGGAVAVNERRQVVGLDFGGRSFLWSGGAVTWLTPPIPDSFVQAQDIKQRGSDRGHRGLRRRDLATRYAYPAAPPDR